MLKWFHQAKSCQFCETPNLELAPDTVFDPALVCTYPIEYNRLVRTFLRSDEFNAWLAGLRDHIGRARIVQRIRSAEAGNFGDCEPVGEGVSEMRIHSGPGYRLYYTQRGAVVYLLLMGGDKSTQRRDIKSAFKMARELKQENRS